ncbi:hypothetical protein ScPMuIL_011481 [Solemya velum]
MNFNRVNCLPNRVVKNIFAHQLEHHITYGYVAGYNLVPVGCPTLWPVGVSYLVAMWGVLPCGHVGVSYLVAMWACPTLWPLACPTLWPCGVSYLVVMWACPTWPCGRVLPCGHVGVSYLVAMWACPTLWPCGCVLPRLQHDSAWSYVFLPDRHYISTETLSQDFATNEEKNGSKAGAGNLGVHVEGPFISKEKKGAHPENLIPPELDRAGEVISEITNRGIKVSVGHSIANLVQGEEAVKNGATFITHLFNAMLPFHHRDPHLVGLLTSNRLPEEKTVFYGLISDGIHTHPAALRIAQRVHPKGLVLVTDAIPAMGLPGGQHHMGDQMIEIKGERAVIAGTDTLCGSIATIDTCVRHFAKATQCGVVEALEAASLHPAQMLGITDRKGTLEYGTDADFIIVDHGLNIQFTFIAGELVWSNKDSNVISGYNI